MTDMQAIDVVTFDFKGTCVRCFVSGSTDYQMNLFVCLFDLIPYVPSTIFQLYRDGSSWVEPVLS